MHHNVVTYYVLCFREYKRKPSSFQVSNMFLMSLAIADLTVGTIVMPISSAYAITGTYERWLRLCRRPHFPCESYLVLSITSIMSDATLYNMVSLQLGNVCHLS